VILKLLQILATEKTKEFVNGQLSFLKAFPVRKNVFLNDK
jgi:hypothetical protein